MITKLKAKYLKGISMSIQLLDTPIVEKERNRTPIFGGRVRYNLARTLKSVEAELEVLEDTQKKLFRQYLGQQPKDAEGGDKLVGEWAMRYSEEMDRVLESVVEIDIRPVKLAELNFETNQTNCAALGRLMDTVIEDEDKPKLKVVDAAPAAGPAPEALTA